MKKIFLLIISALFVGCADELESFDPEAEGAIELTGIRATIVGSTSSTRAENDPVYLSDHISRFRFENEDKMTFTTIKRSDNPIARFNYVDIAFTSNENGAWSRDKGSGHLVNGLSEDHPQRVYWSDATSQHTFIGYSLPKVANSSDFEWTSSTAERITTYYGAIGNSTVSDELIDYNPTTIETDEIKVKKDDGTEETKTIKKSSKMRAEDLLLSYSTTLVPDGPMADVKFYHALSSIKVQVSMSNFYGSALDAYTVVEDMQLLDQPTLYKWDQSSAMASARSTTHSENKPKTMKLWDYYPGGTGSGASKTFTFYGITVPQESTYPAKDLTLRFKVKFPDPVKTDLDNLKKNPETTITWITKDFSATISASTQRVYFHPGQCTVINLRLNHMDEELTIGAEYMDWMFKASPDEGELRKSSTFLPALVSGLELEQYYSSHGKIADQNTTIDDATWLYYKKENGQNVQVNGKNVVLDVFGNDGTSEKPYKISSAIQLISFANEVNGGRSFEDQFIVLDADIFLQPNTTDFNIDWEGIGNETTSFNGTFIGGGRKISRLKGSPLFSNLGPKAVIDNLVLADKIEITGTGALANSNAGKIVGCVIDADVKSSAASTGSLLGSNVGSVVASYHIGSMEGTSAVAGLVGQNSGSMVSCYNSGTIKGSGTNYGVTCLLTDGKQEACYYNKTLAGSLGGEGKTTIEMQKMAFANTLNFALPTTSKYSFKFNAAQYPSLELYNFTMSDVLQDGFYRVQNYGSQRYVYVIDNTGTINSNSDDLGAIELKKNSEFLSDPASIVYVQNISGNEYNLYSQGTNVNSLTRYNVAISPRDGHYTVGAVDAVSSFRKLLVDEKTGSDDLGKAGTSTDETNNRLWDAIPVDASSENYFGLVPSTTSITIGDKTLYYAPFYAGFGFEPYSDGMEVFYISGLNESEGKACLKKITGTIPANTPVIVACASTTATNNRLTLKNDNSTIASKNFLEGNMFNSTVSGHVNQKQYDSNTMRVLDVRDGKLAFVKKNESDLPCLPANSSYLVVSADAPDVIYVETEENYNSGSSSTFPIATGYYHVKNYGSNRYLSVIDDQVTINVNDVNITHDLGALALNNPLNTSDPGSIIYVTSDGDITCQGVSLRSKIPGFTVNERTDSDDNKHYRVGAERSGLSRYICDAVTSSGATGKVDTHVGADKKYLLWDVVAANDFALSSTISVDSKNYVPFYAEFGFEIPSNIEVYYVKNIDQANAKVVLSKLSGTIPNNTPVIIAYTGSGSITPTFSNQSLNIENKLSGNMFNTAPVAGMHENRKQVTENMRILGVDSEGKLVFKKAADTTYLPANSSYLQGDNLPDTLTVEIETQP